MVYGLLKQTQYFEVGYKDQSYPILKRFADYCMESGSTILCQNTAHNKKYKFG